MQPLVDTTGSPLADRTVQGLANLFELSFPDQRCSWYVQGSYADGTAIPTSDIDLMAVFEQPITPELDQRVEQLVHAIDLLSTLELDIGLYSVQDLADAANPTFKLGAKLLYGRDVREEVPLMPIEQWARRRMHVGLWLVGHGFRRPQPLTQPLSAPDPEDAFLGYATRPMTLPDGTTILTTRNLIRQTGWIATARLAHEARRYVVRKRECVQLYRELIADEWTELLTAIDRRCRQDWQYRIPDSAAEQAELRAIVEQTLAYEEHFLGRYRTFLLAELANDDRAAQLAALNALEKTRLADPAVLDALHRLAAAQAPEISEAAQRLMGTHS